MHHRLISGVNVSRETIEALEHFAALIEKWTVKINLISKASLADLWDRHILDSAQLLKICPRNIQNWLDLGSGGGLPGVVVAILAKELIPKLTMTLVESDKRKSVFLRTAIRELELNATVLNARIEKTAPLQADVISARALAELGVLLALAEPHLTNNTICLFQKGENWQKELSKAQQSWSFHCDITKSETQSGAIILKLGEVGRA
ncbi:MAG: 16S rRNA (guanine(527)-N(7))-methyltransferase RsmG [Marinovum sp.]|nr:16S rRNA (guanine(527)-N(7))-methyltransferase RsmG [Marinovum sp.]